MIIVPYRGEGDGDCERGGLLPWRERERERLGLREEGIWIGGREETRRQRQRFSLLPCFARFLSPPLLSTFGAIFNRQPLAISSFGEPLV